MIKLNKEEYDYLKFIEHEYTNLFDDVEDLINNTDDLKYHDMLKLDYEQLYIIWIFVCYCNSSYWLFALFAIKLVAPL